MGKQVYFTDEQLEHLYSVYSKIYGTGDFGEDDEKAVREIWLKIKAAYESK